MVDDTLLLIINGLLYASMAAVVAVIGIIDYRTCKIPPWTTGLVGIIGLIYNVLNPSVRAEGVLGFFSVSAFLCLVYILTKGKGIGGGDIKLMAVSGLILGWQKNILAFFVGCVLALAAFLCRKTDFQRFPFGPYLAAGIFISMLWGENLISAYLSWPGIRF